MKTIQSECGKYSVNIIKNGGGGWLAIANENGFDSETMKNQIYWFTIGMYASEKNAIRQAVKKMQGHNITLAI